MYLSRIFTYTFRAVMLYGIHVFFFTGPQIPGGAPTPQWWHRARRSYAGYTGKDELCHLSHRYTEIRSNMQISFYCRFCSVI